MDQFAFRRLISGEEKSLKAQVLRLLLSIVSVLYKSIICLRNFAFDKGLLKSNRVNAHVISIGNITAGGTGKTPLVIWLCNHINRMNLKSAILTRGYMSEEGSMGDEPTMLAKSCPESKVIVNSDRTQGARKTISENGSQVLILDDGFQHRKIKRDLDIIAIDATCPFGYDKILPAGLLRESPDSLKRAHAVVITRFDQLASEFSEDLENRIRQYNPNLVIAKATHKSVSIKFLDGREDPFDTLSDKRIFAFCGIGNPASFIRGLKSNGINLAGNKIYNDHHNYTRDDVKELAMLASQAKADIILTTQKDWVKIALFAKEFKNIDFAYVKIDMEFIDGQQQLLDLINSTLNSKISG